MTKKRRGGKGAGKGNTDEEGFQCAGAAEGAEDMRKIPGTIKKFKDLESNPKAADFGVGARNGLAARCVQGWGTTIVGLAKTIQLGTTARV